MYIPVPKEIRVLLGNLEMFKGNPSIENGWHLVQPLYENGLIGKVDKRYRLVNVIPVQKKSSTIHEDLGTT